MFLRENKINFKIQRFVGQSAAAMEEHTGRCEEAISTRQPAKMVDNTSSIARLMFEKCLC